LGYNVAVIAFWLVTMSWLVWTRLLPPLLLGSPPTYTSMLEATPASPVVWDIYWDDEPVGTARSEIKRETDGVVQMLTRVAFENLPLAKLNPLRIKALTQLIEEHYPRVSMSSETRFDIDPLGRLLSFESSLASSWLPEPIRVLGNAEDRRLSLAIRSGDFRYRTYLYLPPERPIGDAFSPRLQLPRLRPGQSWSEPVYSPFSPPNAPLELLQAKVQEDLLYWNGQIERTLMVVYRGESGGRDGPVRGRTWVRRDGAVLQQEVRIGGCVVRFVRRADDAPSEPAAGAKYVEGAAAR
jgi:hypothetical protein